MAIAADCKSAPSGFGGSSPPPPTKLRRRQVQRALDAEFWCKPSEEKVYFLFRGAAQKPDFFEEKGGSSSVGRASAFQAEGREFEPRFPLK